MDQAILHGKPFSNPLFVKVSGHYQVALPWRSYPPHLHDNRELAAKRCELLKRRLLKDGDLAIKYKAAMNDYTEKGHAERVPDEESRVSHIIRKRTP